ncbi:MAG: glycosyltransferase family 4 protein [Caldilineaceae bacterium]
MRVLVISWEFPPFVVGGMGKHVAELIPELGGVQENGEPLYVDVLTTDYNGGAAVESLNKYVTIYRCHLPGVDAHDLYNSVVANNELLVKAGRTRALLGKYDLIHIHDWLVGEAGIQLKHEWKIPLVATIHATERGRHQGYIDSQTSIFIDRMEWRICFESWRVVVCSNHMAGELHHFFGTPYDKIDIIANGIGKPRYTMCAPSDMAELRQRYAPNNERMLFYVGRITYEKGPQVLLQAMPHILSRFPNTRLLIAGKNSQQLGQLAYELRLDNRVEFLGYISDERRDCLYRVVDSAVFPSLYEPFGIVALEAMQQGCNVIASDVGGLGEVVRHHQNGLTVYPNDPYSIAWAVNELFTHPRDAEVWRAQAQREVNELYRWERIARETWLLYVRVRKERQLTNW